MTRENLLKTGSPLFCDLYHLSMAQTWFLDGKANEPKTSEAFFRRYPFGGSYVISAGLAEFVEWLKNWHFSDEDINYLRSEKYADGAPKFEESFLKFIQNEKLKISVDAVPEGRLIFANEPVYSVFGPTWQVELVEAALLNIFNSQSLIATKASRMAYAACLDGVERPLLEFGLRRAQDFGCFSATRAAYIGGATATSNVAAAKHYHIPSSGTMAHSFVMSYEKELDAFKAFMRYNPKNTSLLVDTYNICTGIQNAIKAAQETGLDLMGVRIDSGDLAYWGKEARHMLDNAGFKNTKLIASNDLDEHLIENLVAVQKAPYDIFAAGTKLVTAYDTPALGGVFKTKSYKGKPQIKVAEGKTTIPGATNVIRILRNGLFEGDIICQKSDANLVKNGKLSKNITSYNLTELKGKNRIFKKGEEAQYLLENIISDGKIINIPETNLSKLHNRTKDELSHLDATYKRLSNPHIYGVGLEEHLYDLREKLIKKHLKG
ncbi:MAG TPA: nicotinate phosphoribosyltransferase [Alphaproteobacteria bacterium]|nr:nicotinate phosphoribosyltransferase [Alphaproteobacteria bacterium]